MVVTASQLALVSEKAGAAQGAGDFAKPLSAANGRGKARARKRLPVEETPAPAGNRKGPPGLIAQWSEDIGCVFERDPAARNRLEIVLTYPGVHALLLHRLNHRLWHAGWHLPARLLAFTGRLLTNVDIHPGATIGRRLFIDHGAGVVIGETAEIGNDVTLYHGVTLGGTTWHKTKRHPTLGDNVLVGAGAKVLGPITIGNQVRVGANSVVVKDIPPCCTVVGIPGKIVQRKTAKIQNLRGIDLDHHQVPDPVGRAIGCLLERIETLEHKLEATGAEHCGDCEAEHTCASERDHRPQE